MIVDKGKLRRCLPHFGNVSSLTATALLLLMLPAAVYGQFIYTTNNGTITITAYYSGPSGAAIIPSTINGLPVVSIGNGAFYNTPTLTNVTIPDSVTNIGVYAFYYCENLTEITVDSLNSSFTSVAGVLFNKSQTTLIRYPGGKAGNYTIPNSVNSIESYAFYFCANLTSLTIPSSVTNIGDYALGMCAKLTNVMIPDTVSSIAHGLFYSGTNLTRVIIGNSVTNIGDYAFANCTNLTSITIPNKVKSIGGAAFLNCQSLSSLYFRGDAPSGGGLFSGNAKTTVYYLPGTTGWGSTFAGRPTALWPPGIKTTSAQTGQFGFNIYWVGGQLAVVEVCTNLTHPVWFPLQTITLPDDSTDFNIYYSDSQWTNPPGRFYRLRSP